MIAVNSQGVVGVSWYDRRESADNFSWRSRFSASLDGGETFLPSVSVAEAPYEQAKNHVPAFVPKQGEARPREPYSQAAFTYTGGDTGAIAADASGAFHVFWTDTRAGIAQVWTSTVIVAPPTSGKK
jgi:hypothetical protein